MKKFMNLIFVIIFLLLMQDIVFSDQILYEFSHHPLPDKYNKSEIIDSTKLIKIKSEYRGPANISSYAVNAKGYVAIAFKSIDSNNQRINIYDNNGSFIYGFKFFDSGASQILFDQSDDNIIIYFNRSDILLKFNTSAEIIDIYEADISQKNINLSRLIRHQNIIVKNKIKYCRESILPKIITEGYPNGYTILSMRFEDGTSKVIFDNTIYHWFIFGLFIIAIPAIFISTIFTVKLLIRKRNRNQPKIA